MFKSSMNKKRTTIICKPVSIKKIYRYMETELRMLTIIEKGNAFYLYGCKLLENQEDLSLSFYANEAWTYVLESLEKEWTFSQILSRSQDELSYPLAVQSLETIFEGMLSNPRTTEPAKLFIDRFDDLQMFNHSTYETLPLQKSSQRNTSDHTYDASNSSDTSSSSSDDHISLNNTSLPNTSSQESLFNNGNNNQIILLTVLAFTAIVLVAWYVKKYHPETVDTNEETTSTSLHSVNENIVNLNKCIIQLALVLVPTILYYLYHYRYYYYFLWVKKDLL